MITKDSKLALLPLLLQTLVSGSIAYAWYVWAKDYVGKPTIEWIR